MKTKAILLSAAAAALMALPALAQDTSPAKKDSGASASTRMSMAGLGPMDTNHDGVISKDEWMAVFDRMDLNHDGKITKDEIQAMQRLRTAKMKARGELPDQGASPPQTPPQKSPGK